MLRCIRTCLTRHIPFHPRNAVTRHPSELGFLSQHPPHSLLYSRWYADTAHEQQNFPASRDLSQQPDGPTFHRYHVPPRIPPSERCFVKKKLSHRREDGRIERILQERLARLPRSAVPVHSEQDQKRLEEATTTPSFKTARQELNITKYQHPTDKGLARKARYGKPVGWHQLIDILDSVPVHVEHQDATRLILKNDFISHYTASARPNIWMENFGSGVRVQVLPMTPLDDCDRTVFLQGTNRAVELAQQHLRTAEANYNILVGSRGGELVKAGDVPHMSSINSVSSFTNFVFQLTNRYIPRAIHRETGQPWNNSVAVLLAKVFQDPQTSKFASIVAINAALVFLCRHNELLATAALVYRCARALHLGANTTTYNIFLWSAIRNNNMVKARSILFEMRKCAVPANSHTWTLFFSTLQMEDKVLLLQLMREKEMSVGPKSLVAIRSSMLEDLYPKANPSPENLEQLLSHMDDIFGSDWLTLDSYHRLLRLCGSNARKETSDFLRRLISERKLQPTGVTRVYLTALQRSESISRISLATVINSLRTNQTGRMRLIVPSLFTTAWNRSHYNVCSVLWRYAATRGLITYKMQQIVNEGLMRNTNAGSLTAMRKRLGAKIVAGVQWWSAEDMEKLRLTFPKLSEQFAGTQNIPEWLARFTKDDGARDEQLSLAYVTLNQDLNAWKSFRGMSNRYLAGLLRVAYARDRRWIKEGKLLDIKDEDHVVELLGQALKIPLTRLRKGERNMTVERKVSFMNSVLDDVREEGKLPWWSSQTADNATGKGDNNTNRPWWGDRMDDATAVHDKNVK